MLHNESVNVWTHFFGAVVFLFLIYNAYVNLAPPSYYNKLGGDQSISTWGSTDQTAFDRTSSLVANLVSKNLQ